MRPNTKLQSTYLTAFILFTLAMCIYFSPAAVYGQAIVEENPDDGTNVTDISYFGLNDPTYFIEGPTVRIKDIARVLGVRGNQLHGIGLVTGLAGTGDKTSSVDFTAQAIANMLERSGIPTNPDNIKVDNFALCMLTCDLPAFAREGDTIDVTVAAMGDCESLQGGILIMAPLEAANGEIYAVAQGPISLAGFGAGGGAGGGGRQQSNFLTVGRIPNGAYVEKEVDFELTTDDMLTLVLLNPDFTTAIRLRDAVSVAFPEVSFVNAQDAASINIRVPDDYTYDIVRFISEVENLTVQPDMANKVVINERTGTIVMGGDVQIMPVAIAHGALSINVTQEWVSGRPLPYSGGKSLVVPDEDVVVQEGTAHFVRISSADLVSALNALGATPRDIVAIFQALQAAGALQAQLEII